MKLSHAVLCFVFCALPLTAIAQEAKDYSVLRMYQNINDSNVIDRLPYAESSPESAPKIRFASESAFDTLNPFSIQGRAADGLSLVYGRLMERVWHEEFTLYPYIATHVTLPDDRSWMVVHLDKAARFSDNSAITTKDVYFSWQLLKEKGRPNMRQTYALADKVTLLSPHEIRFDFKAGYSRETAMIFAMMPVLSQSWWQGHFDKMGYDFNQTLLTAPVASGVYTIKNFEAGRNITYQKIPNHWAAEKAVLKGQNHFDAVQYETYRDQSIARAAFLKGLYDMRQEYDLNAWHHAYPKSQNYQKAEISHHRAERVEGFIMNTRRDIFKDKKLRKALFLAFDFDWVNAHLFYGDLQRTLSIFPNTDLSAKTQNFGLQKNHRENLKAADVLLKQAGWIIENGQRVQEKTKTPLKFEILITQSMHQKIALAYMRDLKILGITPNLRYVDQVQFFQRVNQYDFDMMLHFWSSSLSPGTEQPLYWGCKAADEKGRWNYAGLCTPAIDALTAQIPNASNRDDLIKMTQKLDQLVMDEYGFVPLGYRPFDMIAWRDTIAIPKIPLYGLIKESLIPVR